MKKIMSLLAATAMLLTTSALFSACGNDTSSSSSASDSSSSTADNEGNQLLVGMECGYAPFNWTQLTSDNGAVPIKGTQEYAGGYDVEIAKKIAEGLGKELVVVKTEWDGLVPAVESGLIDMIIAGMSPTAERKLSIDFTDNYYNSDLVIVVKKGGKYETATSLEDFSGAKITAQQNTFHYSVIEQIPDVKQQTASIDFTSMRVALDSGFIDGYVSERPEGISASAANPNFAMAAFDEGKGFEASEEDTAIAAGLKKGQEDLIKQINEVISKISAADRLEIMDQAIANQPAVQ